MTWRELKNGIENMPEEYLDEAVKLLGQDIYIGELNLSSAEHDICYDYTEDLIFKADDNTDFDETFDDSELLCKKGDYFLTN